MQKKLEEKQAFPTGAMDRQPPPPASSRSPVFLDISLHGKHLSAHMYAELEIS